MLFKDKIYIYKKLEKRKRTLECSPDWISIPNSCSTSFRRAGLFVFITLCFPASCWVSRSICQGWERRSAYFKLYWSQPIHTTLRWLK